MEAMAEGSSNLFRDLSIRKGKAPRVRSWCQASRLGRICPWLSPSIRFWIRRMSHQWRRGRVEEKVKGGRENSTLYVAGKYPSPLSFPHTLIAAWSGFPGNITQHKEGRISAYIHWWNVVQARQKIHMIALFSILSQFLLQTFMISTLDLFHNRHWVNYPPQHLPSDRPSSSVPPLPWKSPKSPSLPFFFRSLLMILASGLLESTLYVHIFVYRHSQPHRPLHTNSSHMTTSSSRPASSFSIESHIWLTLKSAFLRGSFRSWYSIQHCFLSYILKASAILPV